MKEFSPVIRTWWASMGVVMGWVLRDWGRQATDRKDSRLRASAGTAARQGENLRGKQREVEPPAGTIARSEEAVGGERQEVRSPGLVNGFADAAAAEPELRPELPERLQGHCRRGAKERGPGRHPSDDAVRPSEHRTRLLQRGLLAHLETAPAFPGALPELGPGAYRFVLCLVPCHDGSLSATRRERSSHCAVNWSGRAIPGGGPGAGGGLRTARSLPRSRGA